MKRSHKGSLVVAVALWFAPAAAALTLTAPVDLLVDMPLTGDPDVELNAGRDVVVDAAVTATGEVVVRAGRDAQLNASVSVATLVVESGGTVDVTADMYADRYVFRSTSGGLGVGPTAVDGYRLSTSETMRLLSTTPDPEVDLEAPGHVILNASSFGSVPRSITVQAGTFELGNSVVPLLLGRVVGPVTQSRTAFISQVDIVTDGSPIDLTNTWNQFDQIDLDTSRAGSFVPADVGVVIASRWTGSTMPRLGTIVAADLAITSRFGFASASTSVVTADRLLMDGGIIELTNTQFVFRGANDRRLSAYASTAGIALPVDVAGEMSIELGPPGTQAFGLTIEGSDIMVAHTLDVALEPAYAPIGGERFHVYRYRPTGTLTATITARGLPALAPGLSWDTSELGTTGDLIVRFCGDGVTNDAEVCDDGNDVTETECPYGTASCSLCNADCTAVLSLAGRLCGDSVVDPEEGCDDGNQLTEAECPYGTPTCTACTADCATPLVLVGSYCGDGTRDAVEACDDGNEVSELMCAYGVRTCTGCKEDCSEILALEGPYCGDGVTDSVEACDDGNTTTESECPYGTATCSRCDASCAMSVDLQGRVCGDGVLDPEERCDDGNNVTETACEYGTESCSSCAGDCTLELSLEGRTCGDGVADPEEECDDGDTAPFDGCDPECRIERDGGVVAVDGGSNDAGPDAGTAPMPSGCTCRVAPRRAPTCVWLLGVVVAVLALRRRTSLGR